MQPGDGGEYLGSPDHQNWLAWHDQADHMELGDVEEGKH
jgi:phenol/toluene 2-monooxygenase (NADH) P3/A3